MFWLIFIFTTTLVALTAYLAVVKKSPEDEKYAYALSGFIWGVMQYWSASNIFGGG